MQFIAYLCACLALIALFLAVQLPHNGKHQGGNGA